jgi:hypothetical protein
MEIVLILATILALAACVLFGMATRTQVFILVALTAMVGGAGSVLWHWLYGVVYADALIGFIGKQVPLVAFLGGWVMVFPALLIFATLRRRFGQISYAQSWLITLVVFLFFWMIEGIGINIGLWSYDNEISAIGIPMGMLLALLHTLNAMILLRMLFEYWRVTFVTTMQLPVIWLALQVLTYGIIGAPYYVMSFLTGSSVMTAFGLISTGVLVVWGLHIVMQGLAALRNNLGGTAYISNFEVLAELERVDRGASDL